jgi:hypothetical protein
MAVRSTDIGSGVWLTTQISHARRAWKPPPLKYRAMLSGDDIGDSGESKGVVLWLLDGLFILNASPQQSR